MGLRRHLGTLLSRATCFRLPEVVRRCERSENGPRLLLTFDDGPHPTGTPRLLDVLAEHDAVGLFFLCGAAAEAEPELVRRIAEAGHHIGNHSWFHPDAWKSEDTDALRNEYDRTQSLLEDLTGEPVAWMRPPYGKLNKTLVRWSRVTGTGVMLWSSMPGDFEPQAGPKKLAARITRSASDGCIVCLHDNDVSEAQTPQALQLALPKLTERGYTFAPELPSRPSVS